MTVRPEPGQKVFVVPDVHGNLDAMRTLLREAGLLSGTSKGRPFVVQLGDLANCVMESVNDDVECLRKVGDWVDLMLVGNHEHPYFGGPAFNGFHFWHEISHLVNSLHRRGLLTACLEVDGVLVSHAGAAKSWATKYGAGDDPAAFAWRINKLWDENPMADIFSAIGWSRGGLSPEGGLIWSDWREKKHKGFSQLMGHTVDKGVRFHGPTKDGTVRYCIDLGGGKHGDRIAGAWIEGGEITILEVELSEKTVTT